MYKSHSFEGGREPAFLFGKNLLEAVLRTATAFESELLEMIDASLKHAGYFIVRLKLDGGKKKKTLQLIAERLDAQSMTVEDCTEISHTVSALLDVKDPIEDAYDLEVSSPGLERPLVSVQDFMDYEGQMAAVEMQMPLDGRKKFKGKISVVADDVITLALDGKTADLPFAQMKAANLVATDEMIQALLKQHELQSGKKAAKAKN